MKIYSAFRHPDKESFNGQIADAYYKTASKGHEVRFQQLGEMTFDPILWKGKSRSGTGTDRCRPSS